MDYRASLEIQGSAKDHNTKDTGTSVSNDER
jgi:hypothetical protein